MPSKSNYEALVGALGEIVEPGSRADFSRENIIALLKVLTEYLSKDLKIPLERWDDGTQLYEEHPILTQLRHLASALGDLDKGLTDPLLKPYSHGSNAARPWRIRDADRELSALLQVMRIVEGRKYLRSTAMELARQLKRGGRVRKGKALNWQQILTIHHNYGKSKG